MTDHHLPPFRKALYDLLDDMPLDDEGIGSQRDRVECAITEAVIEAEELAVAHHGRQILAVIEGQGYMGASLVSDYEKTSRLSRLVAP